MYETKEEKNTLEQLQLYLKVHMHSHKSKN